MRVLIVEDNPITQEALEELLKVKGYEVDHAGNGLGALTRMCVTRFDIVIADYLMPGMNGLQLCEEIKHNRDWNHIPIILTTAVAEIQWIKDKIQEFDNIEVIQKPFELDDLVRLIQQKTHPIKGTRNA